MTVHEDARAIHDELIALRHEFHREPEVGLRLPRTQERVLAALDDLPLEISTGRDTTSVTGVLRGGDGPTVLLRADMDALPVRERTGLDFASRTGDTMHACGHDLHTTMLIGAARLLSAHRDRLGGDVVLMFQPGEEGCDGARIMVDEGVLEASGRRVDAAYGMHVFSSNAPQGLFVTRPGTMLSASDELHVEVRGTGGHGSAPHRTQDPVAAISEMITSLQTMVTRQFDMFDPVVLSVGSLHAGTAVNVIPEVATFGATVRTFSPESRERMRERSAEVLRAVAAAHRVDVEVDYRPGYPPTSTDAEETAFADRTIRELFGEERQQTLVNPLSGSEDFCRVLDEVPGSFIGLGAVPEGIDPDSADYNHSPTALFDDAVLADGATAYAELALARTHVGR
ncbi:M20 family metallopeptidase [Saccharopolyspora sp. TS4A08]|uniref:M20 family metallopeptidase n=1 Tax=Saccharopolyspora ipomoeae TaxID=3042027 RepID=A0ABT6PQY2_9PSEU|nr:M20 family metallopeptidase [Saccharopolyspora sp. TS4A08]MDI2030415.1 M20 family metallopeptidase [Saccharopolyspora sp. TS4A08]